MSEARKGDTVKVHYTGTLEDGTVFDSSQGRDPLEFTAGAGMVVPGFDNMILGMKVGETAKESIPCKEAYGERRDDLKLEVKRSDIPADLELTIGAQLQMQAPDGKTARVEITGITDEAVSLDANHSTWRRNVSGDTETTDSEASIEW